MDDIVIWRAARQMRKRYGVEAALQAATRADKLLDRGDVGGFKVWERVVAAINELDRMTGRDDEGTH